MESCIDSVKAIRYQVLASSEIGDFEFIVAILAKDFASLFIKDSLPLLETSNKDSLISKS